MRLQGMPERFLQIYTINILPSNFFPRKNATLFQIINDSLDRSFCNANLERNFSQNQTRVFAKCHQYMGMIGEESPVTSSRRILIF